jgi:hypothetical protein
MPIAVTPEPKPKVIIPAYTNAGMGPRIDLEIELGDQPGYLRLTTTPEDSIEVSGLDLWRAVLALMADPEAHKLKKNKFISTNF